MVDRWQGTPSNFSWEQDALYHIRKLAEKQTYPFSARQCFSFVSGQGNVRECDLLIALPSGAFLIEIKSHPGRARNNGATWHFQGRRRFDNPLFLTEQKAKEIQGQLRWAADKLGYDGLKIPFVSAAVFLSAPDLRCDFDEVQRLKVYGREGKSKQTKLDQIWSDLLGAPPRHASPSLDFIRRMPELLTKMGVTRLRKGSRVGSFTLEPKPFDEGPDWVDYLARNKELDSARDPLRRVRIYTSTLRATEMERESIRRAAKREYLALQGIRHGGIVAADDLVFDHDAGPAVVFRHGDNWQRLDHFMQDEGQALSVDTRVEMVRQLTHALQHAHAGHLYHRALSARSVYVEMDGKYPRLRIANWQVAARARGATTTTSFSLTTLAPHIEKVVGGYLAPETGKLDADLAALDVFGLGALAYLIFTGVPPAESRSDLDAKLSLARHLSPSAVRDEITPGMDQLVQWATEAVPSARVASVADFRELLDVVEDELTRPDDEEVIDPLEAGAGDRVGGYEIEKVLGTGGTARALLARTPDGEQQVLKVALAESGGERLEHEANQLKRCHDSRIVKYIDGPVRLGDRHVLMIEPAGAETLAQYLRKEGRLTIDELKTWSSDLFNILKFLENNGIWHRDIKPDNLGVRSQKKKGRQLVLFDFSLAGVPGSTTEAGTPPYLDPFLGSPERPVFDEAAERYAVAMTLHEMAAAELPTWGDGIAEPNKLPASEVVPQLGHDAFEESLREGLIEFFNTALHRDPKKRFESAAAMEDAFLAVVHAKEPSPAVPQQQVTGGETLNRGTLLAATELSESALSLAHQRLGITTVGDLMDLPGDRIKRLRGTGYRTRNELAQRAAEWRRLLGTVEPRQDPDPEPVGTDAVPLRVDQLARQLVPDGNDTNLRLQRMLLGLHENDRPRTVPVWAPIRDVAEAADTTEAAVSSALRRGQARWSKMGGTSHLIETMVKLVNRHGRIMSPQQLAIALLAERGSKDDDPDLKLAQAEACVRAGYERESIRPGDPKLIMERLPNGSVMLVANSTDPSQPNEDDLLEYAADLGAKAEELVDLAETEPLPAAGRVRSVLRAVEVPEGAPALSDADLVQLAASASLTAAVTPRLELYPVNLRPDRVLTLTQLGLWIPESTGDDEKDGIEADALLARVSGRFPELRDFPRDADGLLKLLRDNGLRKVEYVEGSDPARFRLPPGRISRSLTVRSIPTNTEATPVEVADARLTSAIERGGFLAVKTRVGTALHAAEALSGLPEVVSVDVGRLFVPALRGMVSSRVKPTWERVLEADATPADSGRLNALMTDVWEQLEAQLRETPGVVLLHNATPLSRYPGGRELLTRLQASARRPDRLPHGLWLLCPMQNPAGNATLDHISAGVISSAEQLNLPSGFARRETVTAKGR